MPAPQLPPLPDDIVDQLNGRRGGFNTLIGLRFVVVTYDEVVAEIDIDERHHQPYGLVHGGVHSAMIETLASVGAAMNLAPLGRHTVGLENSTSFLRAVRDGTIRGTAVPLARGKRSHVWQVTISDSDGRAVASGRVRMIALESGAAVAGETVRIKAGS